LEFQKRRAQLDTKFGGRVPNLVEQHVSLGCNDVLMEGETTFVSANPT
jgi:hypothetical protein